MIRIPGYCLQETLRHLPKIGANAASVWESQIHPLMQLVPIALAIRERSLGFPKAKDRAVLITALAAKATVLLQTPLNGIARSTCCPARRLPVLETLGVATRFLRTMILKYLALVCIMS